VQEGGVSGIPPGAAHMSSTRLPGRGFNECAATRLGRFCANSNPGMTSPQEGLQKTGSTTVTARPPLSRNISLRDIAARPSPTGESGAAEMVVVPAMSSWFSQVRLEEAVRQRLT